MLSTTEKPYNNNSAAELDTEKTEIETNHHHTPAVFLQRYARAYLATKVKSFFDQIQIVDHPDGHQKDFIQFAEMRGCPCVLEL